MQKLIIACVLLLFSCCREQDAYVSYLANKGRPHHYVLILPIVGVDTTYQEITNTELHQYIYSKSQESASLNFETYLTKLINRKQTLRQEELPKWLYPRVAIDQDIVREYNTLGIHGFIGKYFDKVDAHFESKGGSVFKEPSSVVTILKITFDNKYLISFNDLSARYHLYKKLPQD